MTATGALLYAGAVAVAVTIPAAAVWLWRLDSRAVSGRPGRPGAVRIPASGRSFLAGIGWLIGTLFGKRGQS